MRILVVSIVHIPLDARILHRQIRSMLEAGWEVTYAAPWEASGQSPPLWASGGGLRTLDVPRASGRRRLRAARRAREVIASLAGDLDLVLVHDVDLLPAVRGLWRDTPVAWDVHEDTAAALTDRQWVPRWAIPAARVVVRATEAWAERRLHLVLAEPAYGERFDREHPVVPNHPVVPADAADPDDNRVVYVGRVSAGRGARELVELGRRLSPDVSVEVVGPADDDVRDLLEAASERREVVWHGFLPNDEALARVDGAMAGLSLLGDDPNYRVSTPTKVLEYLARGVPVVTTPLPEAVRIVDENACGVVVPFADVDAVEAAVRDLRVHRDERQAMGRRGRAVVRERYSWQRTAPRFLDVLAGWAGRL